MKRILLGIAGLAALLLASQAASAADMAVKAPPKAAPPPTWTGFYVGLNGGIGWGQSKQTDTFGATSGWYNQDGIFAGGTIGANYQINKSLSALKPTSTGPASRGAPHSPYRALPAVALPASPTCAG
jgi:outer membrane immunogenic protein